MGRPGRTLVGVVAQAVSATVRAAHALCLRGVEVALADHPGGLVAGELQRGGGGRELHRQGGSRSLRNTTISFLHRFASVSVQKGYATGNSAITADRRRGALLRSMRLGTAGSASTERGAAAFALRDEPVAGRGIDDRTGA